MLFRANDEHHVVKAAHDPFSAEQHRKRTRCACRFGVHRRDPAQFRIDFRNKRAELQLFRELPGVEIPNRTRLNFCGINFRVVDRFFSGLDDDVPDRFSLLLEVAFKIRPPAAENIN